ncbi:hypothetical protein D6C79_01093 [Aureobasidium pullulans]|nr:hypothetical protein D6C79_01093 [Aureobasidium pullulans]
MLCYGTTYSSSRLYRFDHPSLCCRSNNQIAPSNLFFTSRDVSSIALRTTPIPDHFLYTWRFLDYTLDQIIDFAIAERNGSDFSPTNMVILDERTNDDQTCLSLLKNEANEEAIEYVQTVETGCGDVEGQLSTRYSGSDGVVRTSMRDG